MSELRHELRDERPLDDAPVPELAALEWTARSAAGLNALGLGFAVLGMRDGSPVVPLETRLAYLSPRPLGWTLGWGVWMLAALALVALLVVLARALRAATTTWLAPLALVLGSMGAAVDLLCDVTQMNVVPEAARRLPPEHFLVLERACWSGGIVVASGLYCLAIGAMTLALRRAGRASALVRLSGAATFGGGVVWAVSDVCRVPDVLELVTGLTVGSFVAWALCVPAGFRTTGRRDDVATLEAPARGATSTRELPREAAPF